MAVSYNLYFAFAFTMYNMTQMLLVPLSTRNTRQRDSLAMMVSMGQSMLPGALVYMIFPMIFLPIMGAALAPFTAYTVTISAADNYSESAEATAVFSTGRLGTPWQAKWITDATVPVPEKSSPAPPAVPPPLHIAPDPCPRLGQRHGPGRLRAVPQRREAGRGLFRPRLHQLSPPDAVPDLRNRRIAAGGKPTVRPGGRRLGGGRLYLHPA